MEVGGGGELEKYQSLKVFKVSVLWGDSLRSSLKEPPNRIKLNFDFQICYQMSLLQRTPPPPSRDMWWVPIFG